MSHWLARLKERASDALADYSILSPYALESPKRPLLAPNGVLHKSMVSAGTLSVSMS